MEAVDRIVQLAIALFVVVLSIAIVVLFLRLARHMVRPDWHIKQKRLASLDTLSQAELNTLFASARAPLNSLFRLLAVVSIGVFVLFTMSMAGVMLLLFSPFSHLVASSYFRFGQDFIFNFLLVAPVVFGLWMLFKARSIQASQEIERLDRQVKNVPEPDNSDLVSALRPGASTAGLRWFGVGLILIGLYIGFKHWQPSLNLSELQRTILSMVDNLRNGA